MNPIAKLHFRRQRLYDKMCEHVESCNENEEPITEEATGDEDNEMEEDENRVSSTKNKVEVLKLRDKL